MNISGKITKIAGHEHPHKNKREVCFYEICKILALYIDDEGVAHAAPTDPDDPEKTKIESRRCTAAWLLDDDNFETMQAAIAEKNKQNIADMKEFFNGNEEPLRNNGKVWTSSLSFGVNCTQKSFILKVWEREDVQIEFRW